MEFLAPAKVNLSLRVLRKREDGFHEIETLMAPISIFDTLEIELRDSGGLEFTCSDPALPADQGNLAVRAARHFCESFGFEAHLRIHLRKEIPDGAGLGGGSSDAATVLLALDHLFQTQLPREELAATAAELGSDVPFFIWQSAARCSGRGEKVDPCTLPALPLLLLKPPFGVPTPWAYQRWRESREIPGVPYAAQKLAWGELVNDLERPVFEKHLQLAEWKRWLLAQPEVAGALMSGSGSTMFAVLREKDQGMALAQRVAAEYGVNLWVGVAETM
jgi:4-diphosphocytidyl-2-C-methyl-D-erythritol kinase